MDATQPMTSESTSELMGSLSLLVFGWKMTISKWRHVAIALNKGLKILDLQEAFSEVEPDRYTEVQAEQAGHNLATERRIYGLSPDSLEGIPDETLKLFMRASREWQLKLQIPPSAIPLPYHRVTMDSFDQLLASGHFTMPDSIEERSLSTAISSIGAKLDHFVESTQAMHRGILSAIQSLPNLQSASSSPLRTGQNASTPGTSQKTLVQPTGDIQPERTAFPHIDLVATRSKRGTPQLSITPLPKPPPPPTFLQADVLPPSQPQLINDDSPGDILKASSTNSLGKRKESTHNSPPQPPQKRSQHPTPPLQGRPTPTDMIEPLRDLYGQRATWTGTGQRDAVEALLDLEGDVIVVLRTGNGKTAVAVLPSMVEDGITVVVVPLLSLLEDWKKRLSAMGLPYETYDPRCPTALHRTSANVVLVSADGSRFGGFRAAVAALSGTRVVLRMVFDEAHLWYTDAHFRDRAFSIPSTVRSIPVQVVLLSATIPPQAQQLLTRQFALVNPKVVRNHPHRPELAYAIYRDHQERASMLATLKMHLHAFAEQQAWQDNDRWLVFVRSIDCAVWLSDQLGVQSYHASSDEHPLTAEERREIYKKWCNGEYRGLVCTPALSAGTDYPHVRLTCHFEAPFSMTNFVQESSRAGRDGRPAHCVIYVREVPLPKVDQINDNSGQHAMYNMIQGDGKGTYPCVRACIGQAMEGEPVRCLDLAVTWQPCYSCQTSTYNVPTFYPCLTG